VCNYAQLGDKSIEPRPPLRSDFPLRVSISSPPDSPFFPLAPRLRRVRRLGHSPACIAVQTRLQQEPNIARGEGQRAPAVFHPVLDLGRVDWGADYLA